MAVASSGTIPEARVFPREAANPHTFHGHETLAQFAFPLLSSFNTHQNMPLCLPRKVHAFKSPSELPSVALPDETGRVWLTPPGPCLSRLLPKLRCSSDIAQTLVLCLTPERCDFLCVGFTVSRGFSEVTDSALTTFPSPSPRAHGRMSVYTFLVPLPGPVRMTSERTVQLAGTWVPCAVCPYCSPGSA